MQCPIQKRTNTLSLLEGLEERGARRRRKKPQELMENEVDDHAVYRFLKMLPEEINGCWEWLGGRDRKGYGKYTMYRKDLRAHRMSYQLFNGPVPDELCVLHTCDNPPCCNPNHLFLGTHLDNAKDRDLKGRWRSNPRIGSTSPFAKLKETSVYEIRRLERLGFSTRKLGRMFGVSSTTIQGIIKRETWKHVP
jgi:hypothetical protein